MGPVEYRPMFTRNHQPALTYVDLPATLVDDLEARKTTR